VYFCAGGAVGVGGPEGEVGALAFGGLAGGEEVEGERGHAETEDMRVVVVIGS